MKREIDGVETDCYGMSKTHLIAEIWSATTKLIQDKEILETDVSNLQSELTLIKQHLGL